MVVSEPVVDTDLFEPDKHFVITSLEQMVETIRYYLSHSQERESIAQNAYDLVVNHLTIEKMVQVLLSEGIRYGVNRTSTPRTW
jgi:spore maturation protein CgeB